MPVEVMRSLAVLSENWRCWQPVGLFSEPLKTLRAPRWQEAFETNQAPRVVLRATHEGALAQNASPWTWRDSQRGRAWDRISVNDAWMKRSNFARSHPIPQPAVQVRMCGKADVADIDAREQAGK